MKSVSPKKLLWLLIGLNLMLFSFFLRMTVTKSNEVKRDIGDSYSDDLAKCADFMHKHGTDMFEHLDSTSLKKDVKEEEIELAPTRTNKDDETKVVEKEKSVEVSDARIDVAAERNIEKNIRIAADEEKKTRPNNSSQLTVKNSEDVQTINKVAEALHNAGANLEDTLWKEEQNERKLILQRVCQNNPGLKVNMTHIIHNNRRQLWPFIYNDQHRLIYCFVSKIASTNWKSAFLVLMGKYKKVENVKGAWAHDPSLLKLSNPRLTPEEVEFRLKNYTKFIFVRDPFARVLSAYRSKLEQNNKAYHRSTGRRIIKAYRPNADEHALKTGEGVTFAEFAQFFGGADANRMDGHWKPIYRMVLPCGVEFDFIGKLETGHEDSMHILKETHVNHLVYFKESTRNVSHNLKVFESYYNQLKPSHLRGIYSQYEMDFKLFGYNVPEHMKPLIFGNKDDPT